MGIFVLYNFQKQSTLQSAASEWRLIPELQQLHGAWTHPLVHCKLPVRAILKPEDLEFSSNHVSFLLVPTTRSPEVSLGLEPYLFQQIEDQAWRACLWLPGIVVSVASASHVLWAEYSASLDPQTLNQLRDGLFRCNEALLKCRVRKTTKLKLSKAQSSFHAGPGPAAAVRCNDVRQTLESFLASPPESAARWSNMPALLCEPDPQPSFGWLRSNFAENLSVLDAMVAMRRDYQEKAWVWGRFGAATLWARAATVFRPKRKPGSKAKVTGTRLLMHADDEERPDSLSRTDCQHHMIWIAALDACEEEAAKHKGEGMSSLPSQASFYKLGLCRMVSSVGFRSSTLFVKPPLQSLPGHGPVLNGSVVLTVLLSDMHEFAFLDHAMQQVVRGIPCLQMELQPLACVSAGLWQLLQPQKTHSALQAWLGIGHPSGHSISPVWSSLLGDPGSRSPFLAATEEALQVEWSPDQAEALQQIIAPVTMLEAPVGAGKTKLCAALSSKLAEDGLVVVVSDTKALCAEHYEESYRVCQRQNQLHTIARMGFDELGREDFFSAYLKEVTKCIMQDENIWSILEAMDLCLELLRKEVVGASNPALATTLLKLGCEMLAWRHEYLHDLVYVAKAEAERKACRGLRVLFMTGSMCLKAKGDLTQWSWSVVGSRERHRVLIDECHKFSREQVTAMCGDAEVLVLLGNYGQGPSENTLVVPLATDSFAQLNDRQVKNCPPTQWHPSTAWARDQQSVSVITLTGTWRCGPTVVELWKAVLPDRFESVYSLRPEDTLFFPLFSDGWGDWVYDGDLLEAQRSKMQFSCILLALCIELVVAATMDESPTGMWALIVTTLQAVQDNLVEYLWFNVPRICYNLHEALHISEPPGGWDVYEYAQLMQLKRLAVRGCKSVGGLTSRVTFVVAPTPSSKHKTWAGDMMEPHLLGQLLSRATLRLYVCGQDLREGIMLPCAGPRLQEGFVCGVPKQNVQPETVAVTQSSLKKQLHWARLLRHVHAVAAPSLGLSTHVITDKRGRFSCPLFVCEAFLAAIDTESSGLATALFLTAELPQRLQDLLQQCQEAFLEPRAWPTRKISASWTQSQFFTSRRALSAALRDPGCQKDPMTKSYSSPAYDLRPYLPAGHSSAQLLPWNNLDDDDVELPVPEQVVKDVWRAFCIPAITVTGHDSNDLVVVVPVAEAWCSQFASSVCGPALAEDARGKQPEWLCRELSALAFSVWQGTSTAQTLRQVSKLTVSETVTRHKKSAVLINGLVHWVPLCNSERPAFVWEAWQEGSGHDSVEELLHLYCAMGLPHASDLQLSLVGRCKDVSVAAALVRASMVFLQEKFHSCGMRFCTGRESVDTETEASFRLFLQELGADVTTSRPALSTTPIPCEYTEAVISDPSDAEPKVAFLEYAAEALGMAEEFSAVIGSLRCRAPARRSDQAEAVVGAPQEPAVQYPEVVRGHCRTAPAPIAIPDVRGVVLLSSLAHAIDEAWLRWRGVTHIVCCLGKFAARSVCEAWSLAMAHRSPDILYLEWNPSNPRDWERVASYCAAIHQIVNSRHSVVLFHCINGKDRSPMAIFAYMRLWLRMTAEDALQLLEARRSTQDRPLFNLYANYALPQLSRELERAADWGHPRLSTGQRQMTWHAGQG